MKLKILQLSLLLISTLHADTNTTQPSNTELEVISKIGEIFSASMTGYTGQIESLLTTFSYIGSVLFLLITVFASFKITSISRKIDSNRETIESLKSDMQQELNDIKKEIKDEIREEVSQQIVYTAKKATQKVREHAYNKIEYNIEKINLKMEENIFRYQRMIYKINQAKKYEYELILNNKSLSIEEKIKEIIFIQGRYNEINNQSILGLFSSNVEEKLIPSLIKLSDNLKIRQIIIRFIENLLKKEKFDHADILDIKEVLEKYYNWTEKSKNS